MFQATAQTFQNCFISFKETFAITLLKRFCLFCDKVYIKCKTVGNFLLFCIVLCYFWIIVCVILLVLYPSPDEWAYYKTVRLNKSTDQQIKFHPSFGLIVWVLALLCSESEFQQPDGVWVLTEPWHTIWFKWTLSCRVWRGQYIRVSTKIVAELNI